MGCCANAKDRDANPIPSGDDDGDAAEFDSRLLRESWDRVRGKEKKSAARTLRKSLTRNRDANFNFRRDENKNWEKLLPKLMEGFERGLSESKGARVVGAKKRKGAKKYRLGSEEALAGISALDLLVRAADDPERLNAVLDQLGRGVRDNSEDPELAKRLIGGNLKAIENAVLFLLDRKLNRRQFNEKVRRTWIRFIERCCERILTSFESVAERKEPPGYMETFSDAAKTFVKDNFWLLLTLGYQLGTSLWRYHNENNDDDAKTSTNVAVAEAQPTSRPAGVSVCVGLSRNFADGKL